MIYSLQFGINRNTADWIYFTHIFIVVRTIL